MDIGSVCFTVCYGLAIHLFPPPCDQCAHVISTSIQDGHIWAWCCCYIVLSQAVAAAHISR